MTDNQTDREIIDTIKDSNYRIKINTEPPVFMKNELLEFSKPLREFYRLYQSEGKIETTSLGNPVLLCVEPISDEEKNKDAWNMINILLNRKPYFKVIEHQNFTSMLYILNKYDIDLRTCIPNFLKNSLLESETFRFVPPSHNCEDIYSKYFAELVAQHIEKTNAHRNRKEICDYSNNSAFIVLVIRLLESRDIFPNWNRYY